MIRLTSFSVRSRGTSKTQHIPSRNGNGYFTILSGKLSVPAGGHGLGLIGDSECPEPSESSICPHVAASAENNEVVGAVV